MFLRCKGEFSIQDIIFRGSEQFCENFEMRVKFIFSCPRAHEITYLLLTEFEVRTVSYGALNWAITARVLT